MTNKTKNIIIGFANDAIGKNKDLSSYRMRICQACNIHHNNWCITKRGGCGCYLPAKTKVKEEKCPINKW